MVCLLGIGYFVGASVRARVSTCEPAITIADCNSNLLISTPIVSNPQDPTYAMQCYTQKKSALSLVHYEKGYQDPSTKARDREVVKFYTNRETPCISLIKSENVDYFMKAKFNFLTNGVTTIHTWALLIFHLTQNDSTLRTSPTQIHRISCWQHWEGNIRTHSIHRYHLLDLDGVIAMGAG